MPIDYFSPKPAAPEDQLQNWLARLRAPHLAENEQVIPSDRLKTALDAVREALISAESSRQITAIAPILVENAWRLSLTKLHADFVELGLEFRLGWLIDNVLGAIEREEASKNLHVRWSLKYRRARILIDALTASWRKHPGTAGRRIMRCSIRTLRARRL